MIRYVLALGLPCALAAQSPSEMRALAHTYYEWRDSVYPVAASDQGKHTRDAYLADYRMASVRSRRVVGPSS